MFSDLKRVIDMNHYQSWQHHLSRFNLDIPKIILCYILRRLVYSIDANSLRHFWRTSAPEADPRPVTGLSSTFGPDTLTGRHGAMSPCSAHNTIVLFTYIRADAKDVWQIENEMTKLQLQK